MHSDEYIIDEIHMESVKKWSRLDIHVMTFLQRTWYFSESCRELFIVHTLLRLSKECFVPLCNYMQGIL